MHKVDKFDFIILKLLYSLIIFISLRLSASWLIVNSVLMASKTTLCKILRRMCRSFHCCHKWTSWMRKLSIISTKQCYSWTRVKNNNKAIILFRTSKFYLFCRKYRKSIHRSRRRLWRWRTRCMSWEKSRLSLMLILIKAAISQESKFTNTFISTRK